MELPPSGLVVEVAPKKDHAAAENDDVIVMGCTMTQSEQELEQTVLQHGSTAQDIGQHSGNLLPACLIIVLYMCCIQSFAESDVFPSSSSSQPVRQPDLGDSHTGGDPLAQVSMVLPHIDQRKLKFLLDLSSSKMNEISNLFLDHEDPSIGSFISLMKTSLLSDVTRRIVVDDYDEDKPQVLTETAFAFYKGSRFDPQAEVFVRIDNQPVIDTGGARRQFFCDVFSHIASSSSLGLFEGPPNRLRPAFRQSSISSGLMNIMGKMVGHSIILDRQGFPFLSPACYYYMAGHIDLAVSELSIEDAGDRTVRIVRRYVKCSSNNGFCHKF